MSELVLGLDIGGTKSAVVLAEVVPAEAGQVAEGSWAAEASGVAQPAGAPVLRGRESFPTEGAPAAVLARLLQAGRRLLDSAGGRLRAAGISCGGPLDSRRGLILSPPNLPGWDEVPVVQTVSRALGVPAALQNDANACALAEWRFGAARGTRNAVFLTFGTGMGAGLVLDGRLYTGANDLAGEVGHVRLAEAGPVGYGKAGSFEGFCSGGGIAELARAAVRERLQAGQGVGFCRGREDLAGLSARTVAEAARDGDPLAVEILRTSGRYLGRGLALLVDVLNPEVIVIGSIFARAGELLWPAAREELEREALGPALRACRVVPAALGERIGDYAAVSVALEAAGAPAAAVKEGT